MKKNEHEIPHDSVLCDHAICNCSLLFFVSFSKIEHYCDVRISNNAVNYFFANEQTNYYVPCVCVCIQRLSYKFVLKSVALIMFAATLKRKKEK